MQLLDLSDHLPGLPRLPGLKKWYARDKVQYYNTWEEASQVGNACLLLLARLQLMPNCSLQITVCYRLHKA